MADVRFSSVDKLSHPSEVPVRLCNYTDVYKNDFITPEMELMEATATEAEIKRFGVIEGDVLLTKDSETPDDIGIACVIDQSTPEMVCGYHLGMVRPDQEQVDPTFLCKQLGQRRIARYFAKEANGLTRYGLPIHSVENAPLWLPAPAVQKKIGSILRRVDALIAKSEAVLGKLRQVRAGLLHDLLIRGLDADGRLRDPAAHPEQFKESILGRIPNEWDVRMIGELIAGFETGVSVDSTDIPVANGEIGVLKTGCVAGGSFDPTQNKKVKPDHVGRVRCNPKADSVIISRMNTPQLVGESAYVSSSYSHVFLPDRLWQSVKHHTDPTCIRWLTHSIQTAGFRDLISSGATGTSGSMKNISQSFFLALPLRTPPKHEQEAIAIHLATHDRLIAAEQSEISKLRQLKSGLMTDLLEGRVRVPEII